MSEITNELLSKLESLSTETSLPLERRLIDTAIWFHKNKDRLPKDAVIERLEFLYKVFDIHLEMVAMLVDRVQLAEGRPKSRSLWLPNGMAMITDDGKKVEFG